MKRIKKVFSSAGDCIHRYAQFTQDEGRSSNTEFSGDTLYSYGRHYVLAQRINAGKPNAALLLNLRRYSNTTSKHQSETEHATRQHKQVFCYIPKYWQLYPGEESQAMSLKELHAFTFARWTSEATEELKKFKNAINTHSWRAANIQTVLGQAQIYADFFKLKLPKELNEIREYINSAEANDLITNGRKSKLSPEKAAKAKEARERAKARKELKEELEAYGRLSENITEFLNGENSRVYPVTTSPGASYRHRNQISLFYDLLTIHNGRVITSQGVKLTIPQALEIAKGMEIGYIQEGMKIETENGPFEVRKIDKESIVIGCHRFDIAYLFFFIDEELLPFCNNQQKLAPYEIEI